MIKLAEKIQNNQLLQLYMKRWTDNTFKSCHNTTNVLMLEEN